MTRRVAILGCGPAGLMVAHAASLSGWDFDIFSTKRKSPLYGAQYLHRPIPFLDSGTPHLVEYKLVGTPEDYRVKVYSEGYNGSISPEELDKHHYAWDLRGAYGQLWGRFHDTIQDVDIDPDWARDTKRFNGFDLVVSTIPRTVWDSDDGAFQYAYIWAIGSTDNQTLMSAAGSYGVLKDFSIVCNGDLNTLWYRASRIFGYSTVEFPWHYGKPSPHAALVRKPLRYNGTAASQFHHMGRYGAWRKGILTSDVFFDAISLFGKEGL